MWLILFFIFFWGEHFISGNQTKSQCGGITTILMQWLVILWLGKIFRISPRKKNIKFSIEKVKMINENIRNFSCGRYKFAQHINKQIFSLLILSFSLLLNCYCCCCCCRRRTSDVCFVITRIYLYLFVIFYASVISYHDAVSFLSLGFCCECYVFSISCVRRELFNNKVNDKFAAAPATLREIKSVGICL